MPIVEAFTWETGAEPGISNVLTSGQPVSVSVETAAPLSGFGSYRVEFGSNDRYQRLSSASLPRDSVADYIGIMTRFKISHVPSMSDTAIYLRATTDGSSNVSLVGVAVEPDGSLRFLEGNSDGSSFQSNAELGATPAGLVQSGQEHCLSFVALPNGFGPNGRLIVALDNEIVFDFTGDIGTAFLNGSEIPEWGWGFYLNSFSGISPNAVVHLDDIVAYYGESSPLAPMRFVGLVPDGVTADNDGTVFGGAANAAAATDERPATAADGFTLDTVGAAQGLTFADLPGGLGEIRCVTLYGSVGDAAAGTETITAELSDGTNTDVSGTLGVNSFASRQLTDIEELDPSGNPWTAATVNALTATVRRTA